MTPGLHRATSGREGFKSQRFPVESEIGPLLSRLGRPWTLASERSKSHDIAIGPQWVQMELGLGPGRFQ